MRNKSVNIRLLTGIPRSGTTLCCQLLNDYSDTVALHEPLNPSLFTGDVKQACSLIGKFATRTRQELLLNGQAVSKQKDGKIPSNSVSTARDEPRKEVVTLGEIEVSKPLSPSFCLVIKHNALFTALLDQLSAEWKTHALVRNPLAVLASWQSVELPVAQGRIPMGEKFDLPLSEQLAACESRIPRQLEIMSWFFTRYRQFDRSRVITYEAVIDSDGQELEKLGLGYRASSTSLSAQIKNSGLDNEELKRLADFLMAKPEIYRPFYTCDDIEAELMRMSA